ncbi:MAG: YkgJ family cysteine cluster protein [Planctomycetes bacterium]|nr:YkgJ family cysteine cluster protein [Planctomycetota bacterium]
MSRRDEAQRNNRARQIARERAAAKSGQQSPKRLSRLRVQELADRICAEAKWIVSNALADREGPPNGEAVIRAADETRTFALKVIAKSPYQGRHECRAGCAFCCHTAVTISAPEAVAMLDRLRASCSPEDLTGIRGKIEENATRAASLSRAEYAVASVRCAMLSDDGTCRVHESRPLACAGFLSLSRAACEAEFNRTPGRDEVPIDRFATTVGMSASYGLKAACESAGLDGDYYELHHALRAIWDHLDAAGSWTRGERLFEGCVRSDAW